MTKTIKFITVLIALAVIAFMTPAPIYAAVCADEQELFTEGSAKQPNVLIILDTSQSMDADFYGNLVGPWKDTNRLLESKKALKAIIDKYKDTMRIGLMTYKLSGVSDYKMHNSVYFASYDPRSYCPTSDPTVLAACDDYCKTGNATSQATCQGAKDGTGAYISGCGLVNSSFDATYRDEITTYYGVGTDQRNKYCGLVYPKTQTDEIYYDATNYTLVYYKLPGTFYASSNYGNKFLYSRYYNASESGSDTYYIWYKKTGTNDGSYASPNPGQYSSYWTDMDFYPTDEDIALGFKDFGRRQAWYYVGRTWFASGSPGPGFLQRECYDGKVAHVDALKAKLAYSPSYPDTYPTVSGMEANYMTCSSSDKNKCSHIVNAGLTPIAGTLQSAIDYFKGTLSTTNIYDGKSKASPITDHCQKNYVILVTDGLPSVDASGKQNLAVNLMEDVLKKIDALKVLPLKIGSVSYILKIPTFVIGMALTKEAEPYLNQMAQHGGTASADGKAIFANDPAGILGALDQAMGEIVSRTYSFSTASISSSRTSYENYLYEATFEPTSATPFWKGHLKQWLLAGTGEMEESQWDAADMLMKKDPADRNMKTMIGGALVDFKSSDIAGSTLVPFAKMMYPADVTSPSVVVDQTSANKVIKWIRGYPTDPADGTVLNPNKDATTGKCFKLGDIFHSSPITLGTPSLLWNDMKDTGYPNAFKDYRAAHPRETKDGERMVITGANDGQFHAFITKDGSEFWSFIPPNLLPKLQDIYHTTTPSTLEHQFFVDGAIMATDAWLPTGGWTDGTTKDPNDWATLVTFSLGRNDCDYSSASKETVRQSTKYWSSTITCDGVLSDTYHATDHPFYCGYYAFDFTDAPGTAPSFLWTLKTLYADGITSIGPYLGEPWSTISPGRVKVNGIEKWIGVIGGGYDADVASAGNKRGKAIIAFDLKSGVPIWDWTFDDDARMTDAFASKAAVVDSDNDGYLDRGYIGDINGNMWQIKFCTKNELEVTNPACDTGDWKVDLLFDKSSSKLPFYYAPAVAWDRAGDLWIYGATGDITDPNSPAPAAWVYGIKPLKCVDADGNPLVGGCAKSDLSSVTSTKSDYCAPTEKGLGWAMNLGANEKVLAAPWVFNNVLYFTSFDPKAATVDCTKTGDARLYVISVESGDGSLPCTMGNGMTDNPDDPRWIGIGTGIASGGTISYGPGAQTPNVYVTVSGGGGQEGGTSMVNFDVPSPTTRTNLIYWKDKRLE